MKRAFAVGMAGATLSVSVAAVAAVDQSSPTDCFGQELRVEREDDWPVLPADGAR